MSHLTYEPLDIMPFKSLHFATVVVVGFFSKASLTLTCWLCNCLKILLSCDMRLFVKSLYNVSGSLCWISFNIMTELTVACFSHETRKDYSLFMSFKY